MDPKNEAPKTEAPKSIEKPADVPATVAATITAEPPKAAKLAELKDAFGTDMDFCAEMLDGQKTMEQAYAEFGRRASKKSAIERATAGVPEGRAPVTHSEKNAGGGGGGGGRSPAEVKFNGHPARTGPFWDKVAMAMDEKKLDMGKAIMHVAAEFPDLHAKTFRKA